MQNDFQIMGNVRLIQNDNSRNVIFVDFELFNSPAQRFRGACLVPVKPIEDRHFFINELPKPTFKRTGFVRSEEHTSELQSLMRISYAVFCLKKKKIQ